MPQFTRRELATRLVVAGFAVALGDDTSSATGFGARMAGRAAATGHIHALGLDPRLFPDYDSRKGQDFSVLTSLNLASGVPRQSLIRMAGGHITCNLPGGEILCIAHHKPKSLVVNSEHAVLAELATDDDHVFGGHGLLQQERGVIVLPQRRKVASRLSDVGSLLVYDARTFQLLDQVESGGIHPHELHPIPGTDEIAVTHYGDIAAEDPVLEHNVIDPKLSILDARTLKPKRHYPQFGLKAMVTHMSVGEDGWAYLVLTQYVRWPRLDASRAFATAVAQLERTMGRRVTFDMPAAALEEHHLPVPLPMLAVHTQTGERRIVDTGDRNHLRSQSVAYSLEARAAVGVYVHSNTLVIVGNAGEPRVVTGETLGLRSMRGVVALPGTTNVAVMGAYRNVVVFDLLAQEVVAKFETTNYLDTHLSYSA